jgi:hypothetical protein
MDPQERARIIASLTDDEFKEFSERAGSPPVTEDPTRQFLRAVDAQRNRDWMSDLAERLFPSPQAKRGNHVAREGSDPGRPNISGRARKLDFIQAMTDPTHEPEL